MTLEPAADLFREKYDDGAAQVAWRTIAGDMETPVSAFAKLQRAGVPASLLESVVGGSARNRYSFIGVAPDLVWRVQHGRVEIQQAPDEGFKANDEPPLNSLRKLIAASQMELPPHLPPMSAGLIGYLGFDFVQHFENVCAEGDDPVNAPEALFMRPTVTVVFDDVSNEMTLVTAVRPEAGVSAGHAREQAATRLQEIVDRLAKPINVDATNRIRRDVEFHANMPQSAYLDMVARAKEYIAAGDIFQVVLSQRFSADFDAPPFAFYRQLRRLNPSPFLFFLDFGDVAIAGSSPEVLVRVRDGEVTVRPIAGTRPRGKTPGEDTALAADLLADKKELAEHLMLLDLGRNDVGRVAATGSVQVTEQNNVERYSHVMHIVSNVTGRLAGDKDNLDALAAGFPAGTVSGAPKIRAMEIINELEPDRRGIYAGAVGYFSSGGSMDSCIALRTAIFRDGRMHVQAGAGIVWDSDPESEYQECRHKAAALFAAAKAV